MLQKSVIEKFTIISWLWIRKRAIYGWKGVEVYFLKQLILHRSNILGRNENQNIEGCSEQNCRKSLLIPPLHLPAHFFETPTQFKAHLRPIIILFFWGPNRPTDWSTAATLCPTHMITASLFCACLSFTLHQINSSPPIVSYALTLQEITHASYFYAWNSNLPHLRQSPPSGLFLAIYISSSPRGKFGHFQPLEPHPSCSAPCTSSCVNVSLAISPTMQPLGLLSSTPYCMP